MTFLLMNFWKFFENFWKNGEENNHFSKIFQMRYIELPILEVVLREARHETTYFFQVVLIRGGAYRAPVLYA